MSIYSELSRRNVLRVGAAYVVAAWLVIQVAETVFPLFGFGDTPARIVVIVLAIGLLPALVLAWAFELTPDGLKKEKDVDRSKSITARTGKKLDRTIMVALALGIGYFAFDKFVLSEYREASIAEQARLDGRAEALIDSYGDNSIAVLAFKDLSVEQNHEYLSDGLAEELLYLLSSIPELRVISRTSAFSFKGQKLPVPEIAKRLNVAYILEGSVRLAGNRVRIRVQLIEAHSDTHLWSETYDRTVEDLLEIQDEIASQVVGGLRPKLLGKVPEVEHTDAEVYSNYLQARYFAGQGTVKSLDQSIELLHNALELDPAYAPAWSQLAGAYLLQANSGTRSMKQSFEAARAAAMKALDIDPTLSSAHERLAWIAMKFDWNFSAAASHLGAASAQGQSSRYYSDLARILGRFDLAIDLGRKDIRHDPLSPLAYNNLAVSLMAAGQLSEAEKVLAKASELSPQMVLAQFNLAMLRLAQIRPGDALNLAAKIDVTEIKMYIRALAHFANDELEKSDYQLKLLKEMPTEEWAYNIAEIHAFRGEVDLAFEYLEDAYKYRDASLPSIRSSLRLRPLRSDTRWQPFLAKIGLSDDQTNGLELVLEIGD